MLCANSVEFVVLNGSKLMSQLKKLIELLLSPNLL